MSDGPHRSLPMRRGWKHVAERGDKPAFTTEDIAEAIVPALDGTAALRSARNSSTRSPKLFPNRIRCCFLFISSPARLDGRRCPVRP